MTEGRRAVGGEFEISPGLLVPVESSKRGPKHFASGRYALTAIVRDAVARLGVSTVLLPDYLCVSMISAVEAAACDYAYYPVGIDLRPQMPALLDAVSGTSGRFAVLLVDYFGLVSLAAEVAELDRLEPRPVIVVDLVHSPFTLGQLSVADYSFTSLRKALPTPDGAQVTTRHGVLEPASAEEAPFVADKIAGNLVKAFPNLVRLPDAVYLDLSIRGEKKLAAQRECDCAMSAIGQRIFANIDLGAVARRRCRNFDYLGGRLRAMGILPLVPRQRGAVPLFLPVLLEHRDVVRAALAHERIFCPVHWPWPTGISVEPKPVHWRLWADMLSLVIDQRYSKRDMDRIADTIGQAHG